MLKIFLINLDKDRERFRAADAQLRKLGIAYERISAVNGRELDRRQKSQYVSRFRTLMTHGMMWSPGQIGCTLSHLFLYRRMMEENIKVAVILEDDVKFSNDFPRAVQKVEEFIDASCSQVVLFSDHRDNINQRLVDSAENIEILAISGDICSEAYAITLEAAKRIFSVNFPMSVVVDAWTRYRKRKHIELFRVEPPLVKQNRTDFVTNLGMPKPYKTFCGKVFWKLWRLLGRSIDEILFLITGK